MPPDAAHKVIVHLGGQYGDKEASLRRFGQAEPLVVQAKTGRVIGGNGRLVAMRKLAWKDCDVVRDESGREHPVMADVGCRNTVFGAEAQEASPHLEAWRRSGIRHFRLEFVPSAAAARASPLARGGPA